MRTAFVIAACSLAGAAQAFEVRPLVKAGFDLGGETLVTATFTSGETETIKANEGFYLGGGAAILSDAKDWEFHLTIAYKFSMINADNGDIEWTRVPLEALAFYRFEKVRVGGGLTYHTNPRVEGSGVATPLFIKFDNALGLVLQADWLISDKIALGARYTSLEYEAKAPASGSAKSNGVGVTFSLSF